MITIYCSEDLKLFDVLGTENSAGKFPTGENACLTGYAESKAEFIEPEVAIYNSTSDQLYEAE